MLKVRGLSRRYGSLVALDGVSFEVAPGEIVVTFIGRLLVHKGIVELVRAVEEVVVRFPNVRLLVVGWRDEGNPAVVSEKFMGRLSSGGYVRFLGKRQDIREILAATDIYALPSYREGTPRTVLEAMAMGKPVITTDAPGCRQTVEGPCATVRSIGR